MNFGLYPLGDGGVISIGEIDSQDKSSDGATIVGNTLYMQTADQDNPGLVGTTDQTFAGVKDFQDGFLVDSISNRGISDDIQINWQDGPGGQGNFIFGGSTFYSNANDAIIVGTYIQTGPPSGSLNADPWRFGQAALNGPYVLDTVTALKVQVGGQIYLLATMQQ